LGLPLPVYAELRPAALNLFPEYPSGGHRQKTHAPTLANGIAGTAAISFLS
jgi:hypothetical protein